MKKIMLRFLLSLLLLGLGASTLSYLFYDFELLFVKKQIQTQFITGEQLETVKIPVAEFMATANHDEVWFNGALYDVKSFLLDKDYVIVTVFHDEQEEQLVNELANQFDLNTDYRAKNNTHFFKHRFVSVNDKELTFPFVFSYLIDMNGNSAFRIFKFLLTNIPLEVSKQPPKSVKA